MVAVDIPRFIEEGTANRKFLRKPILYLANFAIPLKNKILGRTVGDNIAQLQSTGICQFCNFTEVTMNGMELSELDMRNGNLSRANLSWVIMSKVKVNNSILVEADLRRSKLFLVNIKKALVNK